MSVDKNDVVSMTGLIMVGVGVGLWSVPAALVVVGGLLLCVGVIGAWRRG